MVRVVETALEPGFQCGASTVSEEGLTQTFQNPLIKEYTLNYSRTLNML